MGQNWTLWILIPFVPVLEKLNKWLLQQTRLLVISSAVFYEVSTLAVHILSLIKNCFTISQNQMQTYVSEN